MSTQFRGAVGEDHRGTHGGVLPLELLTPSLAESVTAYSLPLAMKSETTKEMPSTITSEMVKQSYGRSSAPVVAHGIGQLGEAASL
jgi:hypothetical protein